MTISLDSRKVKEKNWKLVLTENILNTNESILMQAGTYIKEFVHGDLGRTYPR